MEPILDTDTGIIEAPVVETLAAEELGAFVAYEDEDSAFDDDESDLDDDDRCLNMVLTSQEQEWALRIKAFIANDPELSSLRLSDMMVAQLAIASVQDQEVDDLNKTRTNIENYLGVLESYGIDNTLNKERMFCGEGSYVLVIDLNKYDPDIFEDDDKLLTWIQGCYYLNHCQSADLSAIRTGITYMIECQGYHWKSKYKNVVRAYQEWATLLYGYPLNFTSLMHFHTGLFVNLMTSLGRRFLPSRIAKKFLFGYVSEQGRLDQIYLQPSLPEANQRLLGRLEEALKLRYENEAKFVL